jgi:hypothetical protein
MMAASVTPTMVAAVVVVLVLQDQIRLVQILAVLVVLELPPIILG